MAITEAQLKVQFDRSTVNWWWIRQAEDEYALPPFLLFALGSRETNLQNINGDSGHGRGIWQRDDRSFTIPADYLLTPLKQARDAASLLGGHLSYFRVNYPLAPYAAGVAAYNAGRGGVTRGIAAGKRPDAVTTGGDYSADVLWRWSRFVMWGSGLLVP